jgi:integrase
VGINTALWVSDLLRLQVGHFMDDRQAIKKRFRIKEQKRGKRHEVFVNSSIREIFDEYLSAYPNIIKDPQHFLFFNTKAYDFTVPIGCGQAWKFITAICKKVGLRGNFGTHSLRKTWGYHARLQGVDLALIMYKLNHASIAYTKSYLGITEDELQAVVERLNL